MGPEAREPGQLLAFPRRLSGWSVVIAPGITTIVSYGTTQYLFGVLEVPLATAFAWSRAELSGAYALSLLVVSALLLVGRPHPPTRQSGAWPMGPLLLFAVRCVLLARSTSA